MERNDLIPVFRTSQGDRSNVRAQAEKVYSQVTCKTVHGDLVLDVFTWSGGIESDNPWYALIDDNSVMYSIYPHNRKLISLRDPSSICYTCRHDCYIPDKKTCGLKEIAT